jgi:hypothetical protein
MNAFDVRIHTIRHRKNKRRRVNQHRHATRTALPQAPPGRSGPGRPRADGSGRPAPAAPAQVWDRTGRAAVPRRPRRHPQLAATSLARRPYDLRHAALSLWLNATGAPAEVAARAGNSVHVLQDVHAHCTDGREDLISQQIEDALDIQSLSVIWTSPAWRDAPLSCVRFRMSCDDLDAPRTDPARRKRGRT